MFVRLSESRYRPEALGIEYSCGRALPLSGGPDPGDAFPADYDVPIRLPHQREDVKNRRSSYHEVRRLSRQSDLNQALPDLRLFIECDRMRHAGGGRYLAMRHCNEQRPATQTGQESAFGHG